MTLTGRTRKSQLKKQSRKAHRIVVRDAATQFFFEHAGYSYNPKTETAEQGRQRGAERLAAAERFAAEKSFVFEWNYDEEGCIGCDCGNPDCACSSGASHEVLYCLLRESDNGEVLQSLSGICEPSREYRRVVEAELALEAMPS